MNDDPLLQLAEWGAQTERRVRRRQRLGNLGRVLTSPARAVRSRITLALVAIVAAVAAVAGVSWVFRDDHGPRSDEPAAAFIPNPGDGPFAGTPAATFAEGAAGIALPEARAIGLFSAAEVAQALDQVRVALIAARLDPRMTTERDVTGFLALLEPSIRDFSRYVFAEAFFADFATQVAPGYRLSEAAPRVKGEVTYQVASDNSSLEVDTNFVWVYAFERPGGPAADNIVVVHDIVSWQMHPKGLRFQPGVGYLSNVDCDLLDRSLLAPADPTDKAPIAEDPAVVFDPDRWPDGVAC